MLRLALTKFAVCANYTRVEALAGSGRLWPSLAPGDTSPSCMPSSLVYTFLQHPPHRFCFLYIQVRRAYMSVEQAWETAVETKEDRRASATRESVTSLATGGSEGGGWDGDTEWTATDTWHLFKEFVVNQKDPKQSVDVHLWDVRRILYDEHGHVVSHLAALIADFVGAALEGRDGPADPANCKLAGEGLTRASIGDDSAHPRCTHIHLHPPLHIPCVYCVHCVSSTQ